MMRTLLFLAAILGIAFSFYQPAVELEDIVKDQHIFVFQKNIPRNVKSAFLGSLKHEASNFGPQNKILKEYVIGDFHAFLVKGSNSFISFTETSPLIAYGEPDGIMSLEVDCTVQPASSWGLSRISQRLFTDTTNERFPANADGSGVDAYIIDTGVYIQHEDFGSRATWGKTFTSDGNNSDCNGHGTHVAGILAGTKYGVAKNADIIAVKVLNCAGSGSFSGIIEGIEWVANEYKRKGRPAVSNMSLGGARNLPLDQAVEAMIIAGVSTSVSAGNSNIDACNHSVRTDYAITTGSSTRTDTRSSFSNYGECVDVFSPGSDILSAYIGNPTETRVLSGTSMASPHSAGLAARILSENKHFTTQQVKNTIISTATPNALDLACGVNQVCMKSPNKLSFGGC